MITKLRKEIECFLRATLYDKSHILLVCDDEETCKECFDDMKKIIEQQPILQPEIKETKDTVIRLVNGSEITITHRMKANEESCARGKRANINPWWYAFESHGISDEELDEILNPYIVKVDEDDRI